MFPFNQPVYTNNFGPLQGTGTKALPAVSQRAINQNIQTAYTQTWNFSLQRQVAKNSVLAVDLRGSARHPRLRYCQRQPRPGRESKSV